MSLGFDLGAQLEENEIALRNQSTSPRGNTGWLDWMLRGKDRQGAQKRGRGSRDLGGSRYYGPLAIRERDFP